MDQERVDVIRRIRYTVVQPVGELFRGLLILLVRNVLLLTR